MSMDEFQSPTGIKWNGHTGTVSYGTDNLVVFFYNKPTQSPGKSLENGHPFFEDVLYVRYHAPGERLNINDRPAREQDKRRWPLQWSQFSSQLEQRPDGMPVDLLYPSKPAIAATLRACSIFTVEQLAALSAHAVEQVGMGAQTWVNDAQRYLEAANKGVKASQLAHELQERDGKIRALEMQLKSAISEIERLRDGGPSAQDVGNLQQMITNAVAAQLAGRPVIPANPSKNFDSQTAMIEATHTTREVAAKATRKTRKGV